MSSSDDDDSPREHYLIVQDCQVKRDNFDEWERNKDKYKYINTVKGLPVRVLVDENDRKSYVVGMIKDLRICPEEYQFGVGVKTHNELILDISDGPEDCEVGIKLHMVSNSGITEKEWDTWIARARNRMSKSEFQDYLGVLNDSLEEGLRKLRYLIQNNHERNPLYDKEGQTFALSHVVDENGDELEDFPESLHCCKCKELPIKPYRCPNEHILCEGCFFKIQPKKNKDGQAEIRCPMCKEHFPFQPAAKLWRDELTSLKWSAKCPRCGEKWKLPMQRETSGRPDPPYLFHMHMSECKAKAR